MANLPERRGSERRGRLETLADLLPDLGKQSRVGLAAASGGLVIVHGFWPGFFLVDAYTLGLLGVLLLLALRPLLKSANVAGVAGVEFREELEAAEESAHQVEAKIEQQTDETPDTAPRLEEVHALFPVPGYLRELVRRDPNVALAGLRIELERALRLAYEVIVGREGEREGRRRGAVPLTRIVTELARRGHLDDDQAGLAISIIRLGNRAAHGELVSPDEAELVFEWADTLNRSFAVGYSLNFAPNLDFEEQGLVCEYEHCIEHMPLRQERSPESCPVFGHDCPGGPRRVVTCPAAQAHLAGHTVIPERRFVGARDETGEAEAAT